MPGSEPQPALRPDEHLVLVGMMGTGKSTVGRAVAVRLARDFVDTDELVEATTHKSVREVFAEQGEEKFRRIEGLMLHYALKVERAGVIGCGGGIVTQAGNRALLRRSDRARVVWLRAEPDTLVARLADVTDRPLLDGDARANLQRLSAERSSWYAEIADAVVDVDVLDVDAVVEQIVGGA